MTEPHKPVRTEATVSELKPTEHPIQLEALAAAAAPLLHQYIEGTRSIAQDRYDHEHRMAEVSERKEDNLYRRIFPLLWSGSGVAALVILWACYADHWEIATHLLTAAAAGLAGWSAKSRFGNGSFEHSSR